MTPDVPGAPSDEELIRRTLADRDGAAGRAACSELLERHQRSVYLWCFRYTRDHERAVELAQEVLVRAYRALPSFAGRSSFSSWLFAIARNRCITEATRSRLDIEPATELDELPSGLPDPQTVLENEQAAASVRDLLHKHLDETERTALWMSIEERLPVEEITRLLGLENATGARGLLQRARRKLRAAMGPSAATEGA